MKILPTLMVAALLTAGSAFAASDAPTATPAAATPAKHTPSAAHCEKVAHEKKLKGDEEKQFVKDCKAGKKA